MGVINYALTTYTQQELNMSEIVFILGAGASKEAGSPVMAEFLDKADELRKKGELGQYKDDFDRVFNAISALQPVHSKAELDLDNIESVFAAFEMGRLINKMPGMTIEQIDELLLSIRRLIFITLEKTTLFATQGRQIKPHSSYDSFANLLTEVGKNGNLDRVSIITFNYDLALDYALHFNSIPPDYCIKDKQKHGYMPLMKLHGSLNWTKCSVCGEIIPWQIKDFFRRFEFPLIDMVDHVAIDIASKLKKSGLKHCEKDVEYTPVIVPPTWNKTEHQMDIAKVWRRAALELATAENIFISGYSLPESDLFFRYLFALGAIGHSRIKRFWVFDPDKQNVEPRFKKMIGTSTLGRFKFEQKKFSEVAGYLRPFLVKT